MFLLSFAVGFRLFGFVLLEKFRQLLLDPARDWRQSKGGKKLNQIPGLHCDEMSACEPRIESDLGSDPRRRAKGIHRSIIVEFRLGDEKTAERRFVCVNAERRDPL
jgi:hypothetical protein